MKNILVAINVRSIDTGCKTDGKFMMHLTDDWIINNNNNSISSARTVCVKDSIPLGKETKVSSSPLYNPCIEMSVPG